jgi:hypothetical protein
MRTEGERMKIGSVILAAVLFLTAGCHSYHIETTVVNRTGGAIKLLEVEYPSASFGANTLAVGDSFHYRIQLRGAGALKLRYTGSDGQQRQIEGPLLAEPQEGRLELVLLPVGKLEIHSELTDAVVRTR